MFGGLEIKGATPDRKKEENGAPAAAPAPSSGFSFLESSMNAAAPEPPTAPAASGFSFLSGPSQDSADTTPPTATTASAFGFLSGASEPPAGAEATATDAAIPEPSPVTTSGGGFSFLKPTEASAGAEEPSLPAPSSGFGFMTTSDNQTVSTISRDSPAMIEEAENLLGVTAAPPSNTPVGTGISFGGAAKPMAKAKKKRTRTAKIGTAASTVPAVPSTVPEATAASQEAPPPPVSDRQAAEQATQRAEEFLHQKMTEQAAAASSSSAAASSQTPAATLSVDSDDDDVLAAAKAAAQEAQSLNKSGGSGKGWGLFRARASPPPPATKPIKAQRSDGSQKSSATERLQREQEEHKRAMAARHLELMRDQEVTTEIPEPPKLASTTSAPSVMAQGSSLSSFAPPPVVVAGSLIRTTSPTDKFRAMMEDFSNQVLRCMEEVTRLRQHRSTLLQERFTTIAMERLATQQTEGAEAQQAAAAEAEDFELADRLGSAIDEHDRERLQYASILENIGRALTQLEAQKQETVDAVTKCFLSVQGKLKEFQKEQESLETDDAVDKMKKFEAVAKHLSAENERLEQDHKHLERDAEQVAQERQDVEDAISEQASQYEKLRDEARENLSAVEEEIEELRRQLVAKQALAAKLRTEAAGHDESVLKVRVKFSRQLNRVQTKEISLQDHREEWESEKKQYEAQKGEHDAEVKAHSEALLARDKLLSSLKVEIEMSDMFSEIIATEIGFDLSTDGDAEGRDDASLIQADVVKTEAALAESKALLQAASLRLSGLETEKEDLERRIPLLEDAKKAAAARKDFKAASKASKDKKEFEARLKDSIDELNGEALEKKEMITREVERLDKELEEKRAEALEQERESSLITMQRLADNIKRLMATKKSVCGDCEPRSVQGVGAFVLDSQIDALQTEGETFGEKYGGWKDLIVDIDLGGVERSPHKEPKRSVDQADADHVAEATSANDVDAAAPTINENESEPQPEESNKDKTEKKRRYKELFSRLSEIEGLVTAAAEEEDFERAAELQEELDELLSEVEAFGLTDAEMEATLAEDAEEPEPAEESPPAASEDEQDEADTDVVNKSDRLKQEDASKEAVEDEADAGDAVADEKLSQVLSKDEDL